MLTIEPLLDHPRPAIRALSAELIGQLVERHGADPAETKDIRTALMAHARRDSSVEVRVASTTSLGNFPDDETLVVLQEIADRDPEQAVRYAAEKLLFEKRGIEPSE